MRFYVLIGLAVLLFAAPASAGWFDWFSSSHKKTSYDYNHKDEVKCTTSEKIHHICQYRDRRPHKREFCDQYGNRCKL